jgi:uncharacterized membrane protein
MRIPFFGPDHRTSRQRHPGGAEVRRHAWTFAPGAATIRLAMCCRALCRKRVRKRSFAAAAASDQHPGCHVQVWHAPATMASHRPPWCWSGLRSVALSHGRPCPGIQPPGNRGDEQELGSGHIRTNPMLASFLMGIVGGQRAMTPLAAVSVAAATGSLPDDNGAPRLISHPLVAASTVALAVAELAGDKMKTAPDRIVPIGLIARFTTSAVAGSALVPQHRRWHGAAVGGLTALAASYPGWRARIATMPRYGQTRTGLVEDAIVIAGALAILRMLGGSAAGGSGR